MKQWYLFFLVLNPEKLLHLQISMFNSFYQILQLLLFLDSSREFFSIVEFDFIQVCKIVEGQRYSKRLNQNQIRALLEETCQHPRDRERDIIRACILLFLMVSYGFEISTIFCASSDLSL